MQSGDFSTYKNVRAYNNGTIQAALEFRVQATCDTDYTNYPSVR